jgi:NAD(P)-dependent dehydrogenase (short-subunit alcohol dehydrogenase family)
MSKQMSPQASKQPFDLTGKVALVTGGNGGIGLGMAEGLARAGAKVVIWGQNEAKNRRAEEQLRQHGGEVLVQRVDVSSEQAIVAGIAEVLNVMQRLDFVAANAGVGGGANSFAEFSTEQWRKVTTTNLDAVFWTFREACKHMVARAEHGDAGGSLVVTSSTSAIHGAPRNQAYSSTKGAVIALIRGIAVEYARQGIRANAILPGWIRFGHDGGAPSFGKIQRPSDRARADAPLGRARRFRRHRRISRQRRLAVSHRRQFRHRRRLHHLLSVAG